MLQGQDGLGPLTTEINCALGLPVGGGEAGEHEAQLQVPEGYCAKLGLCGWVWVEYSGPEHPNFGSKMGPFGLDVGFQLRKAVGNVML